MHKSDAIAFFGSVTKLAQALGVTHGAICRLPEHLPLSAADRVRGALVRMRKRVPAHLRQDAPIEPASHESAGAADPAF